MYKCWWSSSPSWWPLLPWVPLSLVFAIKIPSCQPSNTLRYHNFWLNTTTAPPTQPLQHMVHQLMYSMHTKSNDSWQSTIQSPWQTKTHWSCHYLMQNWMWCWIIQLVYFQAGPYQKTRTTNSDDTLSNDNDDCWGWSCQCRMMTGNHQH